MLIWRKDAAKVCNEAASELLLRGTPYASQLATKLRQLAIAVETGIDVLPVETTEPQAPVNEYEAAHRSQAADKLYVSMLNEQPNRIAFIQTAIGHIVDAAAHRVMAQVIGAIEKVKPTVRPSLADLDAAASEARRRVAAEFRAVERKPKDGRKRRKGGRHVRR